MYAHMCVRRQARHRHTNHTRTHIPTRTHTHAQVSFFEYTTLFGFLHFARSGVDWAVLETGCGGRLDATNICERPALTCITNVSLDHVAILGPTVEAIAAHKAGIMKPGVPCVGGPRAPHDIFRAHAMDVGAQYLAFGELGARGFGGAGAGDAGGAGGEALNGAATRSADYHGAARNFEEENSELVRRMLRYGAASGAVLASEDAILHGASQRPPYRMERLAVPIAAGSHDERARTVDIVFDCAHNVDAFDAIFSTLRDLHQLGGDDMGGLRVVLGFCGDKDISACLRRVLQHVPVRCLPQVVSTVRG
jgi:folylpolyglutamate synthase/dihydrofolate synthase